MKLDDVFETQELKVLQAEGGCSSCPRRLINFVEPKIEDTEILVVYSQPPSDGTTVDKYFKRHKIPEHSYTYLVHCRPDNGPKNKEIACCLKQYVIDEVKDYPVVVLVGNTVCNTFFPGESPHHLRGNFCYHPDFPYQRFYCIYDPHYVARDKEAAKEFNLHVERLYNFLQEDPLRPEFVVHSPSTKENFLTKAAKALNKAELVSLDIETDSLRSWDPYSTLKSIAFCTNEREAWFCDESDSEWDTFLKLIKSILVNKKKKIVGHNAGFDVDWLERKLDVHFKAQFYDTQTLYYLWKDPATGRKGYKMASLKLLVSKELDGYRNMVYEPHKEENVEILRLYNGEDVIRTLQLFNRGYPELDPDTCKLYEEVASFSNLSLRRIGANGILFDWDAWEEEKEKSKKIRDEILQEWSKEQPEFDPNKYVSSEGIISDNNLRHYLYKVRKYPVLETTATGMPAVDKSTINRLIREYSGDNKELEHFKRFNTESALFTKNIKQFDKYVDKDGRIHSSFTHTQTDTARTSSSGPNMQNNPRGWRTRRFMKAKDGHVFLDFDFSQIEVRIAMSIANDEVGIQAYMEGLDAHYATARAIVGPDEEITGEKRTHAKALNFANLYGGSPWTVKRYASDNYGLDFSLEQAEDYYNTFFGTYTGLKRCHNDFLIEFRRNKGWVKNVTGYVNYYKDWNHKTDWIREHAERAALNMWLGQGPAVFIMLKTLNEIQQNLRDEKLESRTVLTVHDSVMLETPFDEIKPAYGIIKKAVDKAALWVRPWFKVPLVIDTIICDVWGADYWKKDNPNVFLHELDKYSTEIHLN